MENKIGYKGTDATMKCKNQQYEVGKTYYIDDKNEVKELPVGYNLIKDKVEICSKDGLHYVNNLEEVFQWYPFNDTNRYFKIEVLGNFVDTPGKFAARCVKFLEEVPRKEVEKAQQLKNEKKLDKLMKLETVRLIQTKYPQSIIGGSISLYLHGVKLNRFDNGLVDLDIIVPYFTLFEDSEGLNVDELDEKSSGNDFDSTLEINSIKADVRINPKEKYEIIDYKDFKYKVIPLEKTIEAKARYALQKGGDKHRNDLREMILNKK